MKKLIILLILLTGLSLAQERKATFTVYGSTTLDTSDIDTVSLSQFKEYVRITVACNDTIYYSLSNAPVTSNYAELYNNTTYLETYTTSVIDPVIMPKLYLRNPSAITGSKKVRYWLEGR